MKNSWLLFVSGLMCSLGVAFIYRETSAGGELVRESSGLKSNVPAYDQVEGSIAKREKELDKKESEVKEQHESLEQEKKQLESKIADLEKLREEVKKYQDENGKLADDILAKLVKTYESMEPKKAAGVVAVMEDPLAVDLLMKMKEKKVASMLSVMDPARAMQLSALVANRRPAGRAVTNGRLNQK